MVNFLLLQPDFSSIAGGCSHCGGDKSSRSNIGMTVVSLILIYEI
jgi:hypothetical protein